MTSVTVTLATGSVRTFNTAYVAKSTVETEALHSGNLSGTSLQQRADLAVLLDDIYSGTVNNVELSNDELSAAGISKVVVGNPAAPAAPATDTPIFAALESENSGHDFADEDDDDDYTETVSKGKGWRLRTVAAVYAAAGVVVGVVAGALIW